MIDVLRMRDFRVLETGMVLSMAALQMNIISRTWLAYDISGSAVALGFVAMARGLPQLLLSPIGGVAADRLDKRTLLMAAQSTMAALSLVVAILVQLDMIRIWHLVVVGLLQGVCFPFTVPARQAMISHFVGQKNVGSAFAIDSAGRNLNRVLAPSIGGVLIAWHPTFAFYAIAVAYAGSALTVARLPGVPAVERSAVSAGTDLVNGIRYATGNRTLLLLILIAFLAVALVMPVHQFLTVFQKVTLHVSERALGYMYSAIGVGALLGSVMIAGVAGSPRRGTVQMACGIVYGLALAGFAQSHSMIAAIPMLLLFGLAGEGYMTLNRVEVVTNTDEAMLGRVLGIYVMTWSLMPLAALPLGALVSAFGPAATFASAGLLMVAVLLVVMALRPALWKPRDESR